MEHRSSDTSELSIKVERKIPIVWVLGGLGAGALFFGTWAWNISLTLNNVGRDVTQLTTKVEEVRKSQQEASAELNKGVTRDITSDSRIADLERRFNVFEARQEAKSVVRQQQP